MLGTDEPRYLEPAVEMRSAADDWLTRIDPNHLRQVGFGTSWPGNRIHAPAAVAQADALISDAWRAAGWRVGQQGLRLRNLRARLDGRAGRT